MSKLNIIFNDTEYSIPESSVSSAKSALQSHLTTVMSGSGATINLGETAYSVDSTKLSTATNNFISHLGAIAGSGFAIRIGDSEYSIDPTKIQGSILKLQDAFSALESNSDELPGSEGLAYSSNDDGTCYVYGIGECTDTEIIIPTRSPDGELVTGIEAYAFIDEPITSITIPASITTIGEAAFTTATLENITVAPDNTHFKTVDGHLYTASGDTLIRCLNSKLTSSNFTIPEGTEQIAEYAFLRCTKLDTIYIPISIDGIWLYAFSGCSDLDLYYDGTIEEWNYISTDGDTFANCNIKMIWCSDGDALDDGSGEEEDDNGWPWDE